MARGNRLFIGPKVRKLRLDNRMDQRAMAEMLGISVSYLSQLENDDRPLTAKVKAALASTFPLDWTSFDERQEEQLLGAFNWALNDPATGASPPDAERAERLHLQFPDFAARYVDLHHALKQTRERLAMMDEAIGAEAAPATRAPWELVRDWWHEAGNYVHELDVAAEDLHAELGLNGANNGARLATALSERHGCRSRLSETDPGKLRAYDPENNALTVSAALPVPSRAFQLANQLMHFELGAEMRRIASEAQLGDPVADELLLLGLTNYAAGALVMPYGAFRASARELRHDIDPLSRLYGVSFEQACHRLSTLQRVGQRGIPFFFCRIDLAGNITKRHSATRLQFARFGGSCPLWAVHEAVAVPDRIVVQLAEMPDGVRYVSMAKGLVKPSGSYARAPRRYAIALGCEVEHAGNFIYAETVLGLEVVLPDGRVLSALSPLRKDNTGYDVKSLFLGAEGTLGVITAATLKLFPKIRASATAFVAIPDVQTAVTLFSEMREASGDRVSSFELIPRIGVDLTVKHIPGVTDPLDQPYPWYVLCELTSSRAADSLNGILEDVLGEALSRGEILGAAVAQSEREREALWKLRETIPEAQTRDGASLKHDISLPIASLPEFFDRASAWISDHVPEARLVGYGHVGDGNLHFNLNQAPGVDRAKFLAREADVKRAIHDLVKEFEGSFSAEHGIGRLKVGELERYASPAELDLMRAIKHAFDPNGIMNPGKVLRA